MKEIKFKQDMFDGTELIWAKGVNYLVTYEDKKHYYFGQPKITNGISKSYENELFTVIETENNNNDAKIEKDERE
jgi:hypothetical protein